MSRPRAWWCTPALLLASALAQAHIASNGFLSLDVDRT